MPLSASEIQVLFAPLWDDVLPETQLTARRPLLAHYTTLANLENIMASSEIWFSNPLFMNDLEEVRFGLAAGMEHLRASDILLEVFGEEQWYRLFVSYLEHMHSYFEETHLLNVYVFCVSEHDPANTDGVLSMWRAYGANGNGAALIIDTAKLNVNVGPGALTIAKVVYGTTEQRVAWCHNLCSRTTRILKTIKIEPADISGIAAAVFDRLKLFALFTKHKGFEEEEEWRMVYMPERDPDKKFEFMFGYHNGPRGIEPKLKFPVKPVKGITADDLSPTKITQGILLGPTTSSPLAIDATKRMLVHHKHPALASRVTASTIPLRPA